MKEKNQLLVYVLHMYHRYSFLFYISACLVMVSKALERDEEYPKGRFGYHKIVFEFKTKFIAKLKCS